MPCRMEMMKMPRYKITLAYDGTDYGGWQVQPNSATVQEHVEKALHAITRQVVKIHGSGRTDQGVHARRQVAHMDLEKSRAPDALLRGLNACLPPDIRIAKVVEVAAGFHARKSVKEKEYRYFIWNAPVMDPFHARYKLHVRRPLDIPAMRAGAAHLVGRHDFAALTANPNRIVESTVRTVFACDVKKRGAEVVIIACGEGFLYKMVRSIAGVLVRVGLGEIPPEEVRRILLSRERTARVPTALPQGLFLWNVRY